MIFLMIYGLYLSNLRQEAKNDVEKIKQHALQTVGTTLSKEDKATLKQVYSNEFRSKRREDILMHRDKELFKKLQRERVEDLEDMAEGLEYCHIRLNISIPLCSMSLLQLKILL